MKNDDYRVGDYIIITESHSKYFLLGREYKILAFNEDNKPYCIDEFGDRLAINKSLFINSKRKQFEDEMNEILNEI